MPLFRRNVCNQGSPQLRRLTALAVFLSAFFLAASANAATYYVATNGSNSNPGTEAAPWRNIAYAVGKMVAGDTTYVKGGTYNEGLIRFSRSGTESAPIKLLNAPGAFPVIDFGVNYNWNLTNGRFLFQNAAGLNRPMGWITLEGFEIRNGYNGIKYYNLHDSVIRRNNIHHNISSGIKGNGSLRVLIDRNIINDNGDFPGCARGDLTKNGAGKTTVCNQQHGIYIDGQSLTITNNIFSHNLCVGITQNGSSTYSPTGHAGPEYSGARNWLIANNTFAYNYYCPGIVVWGNQTDNTRIINNIFYENASARPAAASQGVAFTGVGKKLVQINNNVFYASGSGSTLPFTVGTTEGVQYTQSGNIFNVNPNFVRAGPTLSGVPDFHLQTGSPAIDKGAALAEVTWDHDGGKRPFGAAYDIGAYEFGAPPDSGSPSIIPIGGGIPGLPSSPPVFLSPDGKVCPSGYTSSTR